MRNMPFLPYNIWDYFGGTYNQSPWNCVILTPSFDNSGSVLPNGTSNPVSFWRHLIMINWRDLREI